MALNLQRHFNMPLFGDLGIFCLERTFLFPLPNYSSERLWDDLAVVVNAGLGMLESLGH